MHEATHSKHKPLSKPKFTGMYILTASKLATPPHYPDPEFILDGEAIVFTADDTDDIYTTYESMMLDALDEIGFLDSEGEPLHTLDARTITCNTRQIRETFTLEDASWMLEMHWYTPSETVEHLSKFE